MFVGFSHLNSDSHCLKFHFTDFSQLKDCHGMQGIQQCLIPLAWHSAVKPTKTGLWVCLKLICQFQWNTIIVPIVPIQIDSHLHLDIIQYHYPILNRRKFRSQTSDNIDRWKAEQGRGREKRKIRRKKIRRERVRRKKMQMREKVGKSRNTVFFQWFVAPEGRKVGSLKRRVRSQLARWEMKNCTPLWPEAHFQVKIYKTHQVRTTFGRWDVEKVHAVVARSTFSKSKCTKHTRCGLLLAVEMSKKCTPLWREPHLQVKM